MDKAIKELLEEVFLSGDEKFDMEHIRPRIDQFLSFLSKISDAEMPLRNVCYHCNDNLMQDKVTSHWICERCNTIYTGDFMNGYNQCYDLWLPYYLKKMSEKMNLHKLILK